MSGHNWQTVNRDSHTPEDLTLTDLLEEIRCAVTTDDDVQALAVMLDKGQYPEFGRRIATLLSRVRRGA